MPEASLEDVVQLISVMIEVEKTVGAFYKGCSEFFQHDSDFWLKLSEEEFLHANVLAKLSQLITRKPQRFEPGKLFSSTAVRTFISRILSEIEKLKNGTLTMHNALLVAYHFEKTIIEYGYTDIIKTEEPKYLQALTKLTTATSRHQAAIEKKMRDYGKRATAAPKKKTLSD